MLLVGHLIARSAATRTESRGAHFRRDFPAADDLNWHKHVDVSIDREEPVLTPAA
jgi:succinate dehydrogenase/fumarate reductase flavoprotein subunit